MITYLFALRNLRWSSPQPFFNDLQTTSPWFTAHLKPINYVRFMEITGDHHYFLKFRKSIASPSQFPSDTNIDLHPMENPRYRCLQYTNQCILWLWLPTVTLYGICARNLSSVVFVLGLNGSFVLSCLNIVVCWSAECISLRWLIIVFWFSFFIVRHIWTLLRV